MEKLGSISNIRIYKDRKGIKHINQYILLKLIGKGGYAKVKLVRDKNKLFVYDI